MPPSTGMRRSMSVMSGRYSRNNSTACCPFTPCAITSMSATVLMSETNPCRTTAWSSITMMRILLVIQRHLNVDLRSAFRSTVDRKHATNLFRAFMHAEQTEMSIGNLLARIEAAAIVTNTELHLVRLEV